MPRTIDSLSANDKSENSKPVTKYKAGETYRPRGASASAGDIVKPENATVENDSSPKANVASQPNKKRRKPPKLILAILLLVALLGSGWLVLLRYFPGLNDVITHAKPKAENYAEYGSFAVTKDEFEKIKTGYINFDKKHGVDDVKQSERRAADEVMLRIGLKAKAEETGLQYSQADIDAFMEPSYKLMGGKLGLYTYDKSQYGWESVVQDHKSELEFLKSKMGSQVLDSYDLLGIYVRWDNVMDLEEGRKLAFERDAQKRLNDEFLPLLQQNTNEEQIISKTDINPTLSDEINNQRLSDPYGLYVRALTLNGVTNDPAKDPFKHYDGMGENAWKYIEKLEKAGDTTPVFKSDTGMYIAFRAEKVTKGGSHNLDDYRKRVVDGGKVDPSYFLLPESNTQKKAEEASISKSPQVRAINKFLPKAYASGNIDCWGLHKLSYTIRPMDPSLNTIPGTFGLAVNRSGPDNCTERTGFGYFMNGNRQAFLSASFPSQGTLELNCNGVVWDFAWGAPAGYENFSSADYQAPSRVYTYSEATSLRDTPSDISGAWRKESIYTGIANGVGNYIIAPVFKPVPPPGDNPPIGNYDAADCSYISGWAYDPDVSSLSISVAVYFDGDPSAEGTAWYVANQYRGDVNAARGISGNHGFRVPVPARYSDGLVHRALVIAIGKDAAGNNNGVNVFVGERSFSCAPPTPLYNIRGSKIDDFGAPVNPPGSLVRLNNDGGRADNPYTLSGLNVAQAQTVSATDSVDWFVYGYRGDFGTSTGNTVSVAANSVPRDVTRTLDWVYRPRPATLSAGVVVKDGSRYVNPCSSSDTRFSSRCASDSVSLNRTSTNPAVGGYATSESGSTAPAENVFSLNNLYYGTYNVSYPGGAAPGWKITGYIICNEGQVASCYTGSGWSYYISSANSFSVTMNANRSRYVFLVVERSPQLQSAAITCGAITGTIQGSLPGERLVAKMDGAEFASINNPSGAVNIAIPEVYKDGLQRTATLSLVSNTSSVPVTTASPLTHLCPNDALCGPTNVDSVFEGATGNLDTAVRVNFTMQNTGDSIWKKTWPTGGQHKLILEAESKNLWEMDNNSQLSDTASIAEPDSYEFRDVNIRPKAASITSGSTILKWRMAYVDISGNETGFGQTCSRVITLRAFYHPWLRVQNGSTTSLDTITSQGIIGQPPGVRGVRKASDPSYDATYMVMAAVGGGSRFCSSNAYLFGQGDSAAPCAQSFEAYSLNLQSDQIADYFDRVKAIADASSCTTYDPASPPIDPTKRAQKFNRGINDVLDTIDGKDIGGLNNCPAFYIVSGSTLNGPTQKYNKGKGTVLVSGDLTINGNIEAINAPTMTLYNPKGDLTDLAAALPSLGILVKGDVFIAPEVQRLDAYIFATGKIYTCSAYPSQTTGYKDPAAVAQAQQCNKQLKVRGGLYGLGGVLLGRNYFQNNTDLPVSNVNFDYQQPDKYWGEPAEDIIGNGMSMITAPPGFDLLPNGNKDDLTYLQGNFTPKF